MSDDDDEEEKNSSFDESRSFSKEQELVANKKDRIGSIRKKLQQHSKTTIELVDDNDDVSSDEFLDHPGSLPRNSFDYN